MPRRSRRWRDRLRSVELLAAVVVVAIVLRGVLVGLLDGPQISTFLTVWTSVIVAGLPFVVLAVLGSAAVAAFVPRGLASGPPGLAALDRLLAPSSEDSRRGALLAGVTFLLLSPAANPVVIAATAVAFPHQPMMVLARLVAGLATAAAMAGLWRWLSRRYPVPPNPRQASASGPGAVSGGPGTAGGPADGDAPAGWPLFWERCRRDVVRAGGLLVLGAVAVALLTVALPAPWLNAVAGSGLFAVVALALLAVLLSVRAGADAFVVAALSPFSATAQLAFLVVGPVANLRLFTRQVAWPGPPFAVRFAPATLLVGIVAALLTGGVML